MGRKIGYLGLPNLLTIQVECRRIDGVGIQEIDEQPLAVTSNCRRSLRRFFVSLANKAALMNDRLPAGGAGDAIKAEHGLTVAVLVRGGNDDLVADDNRRVVATSGDDCFPENVF